MKDEINIDIAESLRREGFSFKEIGEQLKISKSTAYLWTKDINLSDEAKSRLYNLGVIGRNRGNATNLKKREVEDCEIAERVNDYFEKEAEIIIDNKISCALLYWCEGTKNTSNSAVSFTNSDSEMIRFFLSAFRRAFKLDEKKFRALVHLHEYHDEKKQLAFWSDITDIPLIQFNKSYLKKNTGKRKRENYPGCINIKYFDSRVYKELMVIIKKLNNIQMRG